MTPEQLKALQDYTASIDSELAKYTLLSQGAHTTLDLATVGYQSDEISIATQVAQQVADQTVQDEPVQEATPPSQETVS